MGFRFVDTEKPKSKFVFVDETMPKRSLLRMPKEALSETKDIFGNPYKRTWEIIKEEAVEGVKDIGETIKEKPSRKTMVLPGMGVVDKGGIVSGGKVALGALRGIWSPITGVTRAWAGEPSEKMATKMGVSPTISKVVGIGAELAPQVLAPTGAIRGLLGKAPKIKEAKVAKETFEEIISPEMRGTFERLVEGLKSWKGLRREQEALYTATRGKRAKELEGISERILSGELSPKKGLILQKKTLKGELDKVAQQQVNEVAKIFNEKDMINVLKHIERSNVLNVWQKVSTKDIFMRAMQGNLKGTKELPIQSSIKLLQRTLPQEFVEQLLKNQKNLYSAKDVLLEAINIPRVFMASTDLSAGFRQAIFAAPRHPVLFARSFGKQFQYAFSQKHFNQLQRQITNSKNYLLAKQNRLAFTDLGGLTGEEAYLGARLAEKIPLVGRVIKGSNRAYTGFLNKFRMDLFNDFIRRNPNIVKDAKGMKQLTAYLNAATGRGNLYKSIEGAAPLLNGVLFSPRLMASRIKLLNPLYYLNPKLHPAVRREALSSLISYVSTGMTMLLLAEAAGAKVGLEPASANFGKIIKGNTRFDIWGGFQQYARLFGQIIKGKMISSTTGREYNLGEGYRPTTALDIIYRFGESKENPALSFVTGLIKGQDFIGDEFNVPEEILNRVLPIMSSMVVQDLYDIYKEGGLKDVPWATPAIFGVGIQTYGKRIPKMQVTSSGKLKIKPENVPGMSEDIINALRGKKATSIPEHLHAPLVKQYDIRSDIRYKKGKMRSEINKKKQKMMQEMIERMR